MKKILLILQREYLSRVRKRTFIIMTILGPILFACMIILPTYFAMTSDKDLKVIAVADSSKVFMNVFQETEYIKFKYPQNTSIEALKKEVKSGKYHAILLIPPNILSTEKVVIYSMKQIPMSTSIYITNALNNLIQELKLAQHNIPIEVLRSIKTDVSISTIRLSEEGREKKSSTGLNMGLGYASGLLIYMFIFLFGAQVMRGVIEEKTSRIVEVIVSSVRPFELMMGKIIGIALVGLTQFALWVILTMVLVGFAQQAFFPQMNKPATQMTITQDLMKSAPAGIADNHPKKAEAKVVQDIFSSLRDVNIGLILAAFVFFFLGGYLLYGAMFAAVGSAVDNETDTQQFMLPITVPLILAIFVMVHTMNNPDSSLSFWFSIIPFTSPVVMMTRIPFGVPVFDLVLSMVLLIISFILMTWLAGKIYRVGILMYGKKVNYKELWKWLRYHN